MKAASWRTVLGAVWRATNVVPSVIGAVAALGVLVTAAATDQTDPNFVIVIALLVSTGAIGFTLDDESETTLAASPTTLRRRRSLAATAGAIPIIATWCAALVVIDLVWPEAAIDIGGLFAEVAALALLTLAVSARWGGASGSITAPSVALVMSVLARRFDGLPALPLTSQWQERWLLVAVAALAWLFLQLRDPAASRSYRRWT